jgi:hypothetical protein
MVRFYVLPSGSPILLELQVLQRYRGSELQRCRGSEWIVDAVAGSEAEMVQSRFRYRCRVQVQEV